MKPAIEPSSFRDPCGFLFRRAGVLLRHVAPVYGEHYDRLLASGLYDELVSRGLLLPHEEVELPPEGRPEAHRILRPELLPFVSYPYEWCYSQLRDAALTTLEVQRIALRHGMWLKDASAHNIQFLRGRPTLIDTLSFETYEEGRPWIAYGQFCRHFLAPLALLVTRDAGLSRLLRSELDGVPLDLASVLLPRWTWARWGLFSHLHLHARMQRRLAGRGRSGRGARVSRRALEGLIESLEGALRGLRWRPRSSAWSHYYDDTTYSEAALEEKERRVAAHLDRLRPSSVWDLGANTGRFSSLAARRGFYTVAIDGDPVAVERCYRRCRREGESELLPLCIDLVNPSPALGWAHEERQSLVQRGPAGAVLALALVHHLALAHNVPLDRIARFLRRLAPAAVVEFVPKRDTQAQRLLASRQDVFSGYHRRGFEAAFAECYTLDAVDGLPESERSLYLWTTG